IHERNMDLLNTLNAVRRIQLISRSDMVRSSFQQDVWTQSYLAFALVIGEGSLQCLKRKLVYEDVATIVHWAHEWHIGATKFQFLSDLNALQLKLLDFN